MRQSAALYARFSSDLQKDRSIDDQFAVCRKFAERENLQVTTTFADRARSGATLFDRVGLIDLMAAAKLKKFNVVIVESLDRLSRDQEDLAGLFKRLSFYGVEIRTVNEGTATSIHVGIRGLVGSLFLADLGNKVRRGHAGRVREGKIPGAITFGYRAIPGKPGEREIDPEEAEIVRRIFREYATGRSPRAIAADLTRDGVPTPGGGAVAWNHQTFVGGRLKRGMIGNPIYIGELTWNNSRQVINPETGKKVKRAAPADELLTVALPALRIVDNELFQAANAVRQDRAQRKFGPDGRVLRRSTFPHKQHLLAGLLRCGACGGRMRIANTSRGGASRIACAAADQHASCDHRKSYDLARLEASVLASIREQLGDPELIAKAAKAFHAEWSSLNHKRRIEAAGVTKRLANIQASILQYCHAFEERRLPAETCFDRLELLETERRALAQQQQQLEAEANIVDLHPGALEAYRRSVEQLHASLTAAPDNAEARAAFRTLVETITVHPTAKRAPYEHTTTGRLSAIMGADLFPTRREAREILAEQGVICTDSGGSSNPGAPESKQKNVVISLGRWREKLAA